MPENTLNWDKIRKIVETRNLEKTTATKIVGEENISFWADFNERYKEKLKALTDSITFEIRERNELTREDEKFVLIAFTGLMTVLSLCSAEKKANDLKEKNKDSKEVKADVGTKVKRKY